MTLPGVTAAVWTTGVNGVRTDLQALRARRSHRRRVRERSAGARWWRRVWMLAVWVTLPPVMFAVPSWAVGNDGANPVYYNWVTAKDDHGHTIAQYGLTTKNGGVTDPITALGHFLLDQWWGIYRLGVAVIVECLNWVLQFRFLSIVRGPANIVAEVLNRVVGQLGIVPVLLIFSILVSSVWLIRGRSGAGIGEMAVSTVIAALVGTSLANPVTFITGPNGALAQAQRLGAGITAQLLSKSPGSSSATDPTALVQAKVSAQVLDTFVRVPQQIINFGSILDGPKVPAGCTKAYDTFITGGSVKPVVDACKSYAPNINDSVTQPQNSLLGGFVVSPATFLLALFVAVLAIVTLVITAIAAFETAKFVIVLVKGILPGSSRAGLAASACTVLVCLFMLTVSVVFVGVLLLAMDAVFAQNSTTNVVELYVLLDLFEVAAVIGLLVWGFRIRKHGKKFGQQAANALSPKPASVPSGRSVGSHAMRAAQTGTSFMRNRALQSNLRAAGVGAAGGELAGRSHEKGSSSVPAAKTSKLVTGAKLGGKVATIAVASTIGAPVAAPKATKAAKTALAARRTAMHTTLDAAKSKATTRKTAVQDYGREYAHNVAAAAKFTSKYSGANAAGRGAATVARTGAHKAAPTAAKVASAASLRAGSGQAPGQKRPNTVVSRPAPARRTPDPIRKPTTAPAKRRANPPGSSPAPRPTNLDAAARLRIRMDTERGSTRRVS